MITIDLLLKIAVLIAIAAVRLYWFNAESEANIKRPASITRRTRFRNQFRVIEYIFYIVLIIQLFYPLIPFTPTGVTRSIGILMYIYGLFLSMKGRKSLGINWAHMIDYQVKEKQSLVTTGIYAYVRHPIYAGFLLMLTAIEVIFYSWISVLLFVILFTFIYQQSKREEAVLARHFGRDYLKYMHETKMFFPHLF